MTFKTIAEERFCRQWDNRKLELPVYEGSIATGTGGTSVPYHVNSCFQSEYTQEEVSKIMFLASRIACLVIEVMRRGQPGRILSPMVEDHCIERVERMAMMLAINERMAGRRYPPRYYPPVEPTLINGTFLHELRIETCLCLDIGGSHHWGNMVFDRRTGSRWTCTMLDIG